jgi:hypothetical protein
MLVRPHPHQCSSIWDSFDQRLDPGTLRAKYLFYVEWHFHKGTASARVLDDGCEGLFFSHCLFLEYQASKKANNSLLFYRLSHKEVNFLHGFSG